MLNKYSAMILCLCLAVGVSACSQRNEENGGSSSTVESSSQTISENTISKPEIENEEENEESGSTIESSNQTLSENTITEPEIENEQVSMILSTMGELKPRQMTLDSIDEEGQFTPQSQSVAFTINLPEKWDVNNIVLECIMENGEKWKLGEINHPTAILNPQAPFQIIDDKFHRDDNILPLRYSEAIRIAEHDAMFYITAWEPVVADGTAMQWYYPHMYYIAHDDYIYSMYFNSPVQESAELRAMYEEILSTIKFV